MQKFHIAAIFFILILINPYALCAQGYNIDVKINGLQDTSLLLAYHYATKVYIEDTVLLNHEGEGQFKGNEALPSGMYLIYLPDKQFVDFLIDEDDQHFRIETDAKALKEEIQITGSDKNKAFFNWQAEIAKLNESLKYYSGLRNKSEKNDSIVKKMEELQEESKALYQKYIDRYPGSFFSNFVKALRNIEVPQAPDHITDPYQRQLFQYIYYKNHYFDPIDFSDPGLLRTSLYHTKLENYFEKVVAPSKDSIIHDADRIIEKASANKDIFQYTVSFILNKYSQPKIMGTDAVYVHIAEKYYLSGIADWADEKTMAHITNRVKELKPNLVGNIAPDLQGLVDLSGNQYDLHKVKSKLLIVYFWEPDCGHCKTSTPELHKIYQKIKNKGVEVFAVNTMSQFDKWKEFIEKHHLDWINVYDPENKTNFRDLYNAWSTPSIYVLDENKRIIAKQLDVSQVEDFITHNIK